MQSQPEIVLVLGRRGCGKTTLAIRLASGWPTARIHVHDPMGTMLAFREADTKSLDTPGNLLLLDEIDLLAGAHGYLHSWVREAVHYGRHLGISIIGCARRPANIHRDLTALATTVYLGQTTEPRDLDYCVRSWGESCLAAKYLPPYQFIKLDF